MAPLTDSGWLLMNSVSVQKSCKLKSQLQTGLTQTPLTTFADAC